ncbi:MAG TPA: protein kinase [Polyangiaceae bacterium]|nr:protein kinase [Polyangiaceae bacterium]
MADNEPLVRAPHGLAGAPHHAGSTKGDRPPGIASRCPSCMQHFTGDARFCPFDGDALEAAPGYRPDADPLIGTIIDGRYEVECVLGEGGMGTVYGVRHRSLDKRFALKVMRADMAQQDELAERFIQEARSAAAIGHPNIVLITDFGELPSRAPYFVMEFLEGIPLSKLLRAGGPPPFARAVRILKQVAAALGAAHAAGVIHRDLKPDNIHITGNDVVKVLDFGVAKMAGAGRLTRTGMVYGTPHYMSPEQASGDDVDHRADVYALGIIMYEMFAGRVPFEADSYMGVLTKHMFMVPEPPSHVNAAVRELGALEDVTLKCLEKKPGARYPSMDALIAEVESIARVGSGDRLEILRPRAEAGHQPAAFHLADELEPPAREELAVLLRASGVPRGVPFGLVLGALAVAILGAGMGYVWLRPFLRTTAEHAQPAPLVPSAVAPVEPPTLARPAAPALGGGGTGDPEPATPPPTTPPPSGATDVTAGPRSRQERANPARPPPGRAEPVRGRRSAPAAARSGFGSGDIVNPWAK